MKCEQGKGTGTEGESEGKGKEVAKRTGLYKSLFPTRNNKVYISPLSSDDEQEEELVLASSSKNEQEEELEPRRNQVGDFSFLEPGSDALDEGKRADTNKTLQALATRKH